MPAPDGPFVEGDAEEEYYDPYRPEELGEVEGPGYFEDDLGGADQGPGYRDECANKKTD